VKRKAETPEKTTETALTAWETPEFRKLALASEAGKRGDYRLAVTILQELIAETDAPPEAWLLLGRSFHALKDYSCALAAFNDYIDLKPESGDGYFFAGRTYLSLRMPYRAIPFLRTALENSPGDSRTKALLGTAYLKAKNSQAAVSILEEAVESAPEDKRIYRAYLNALFVSGIHLCRPETHTDNEDNAREDHDLGIQMLRFVLSASKEAGFPESPILRLELGRAAREAGLLPEAEDHFRAALKLSEADTALKGKTRKRASSAQRSKDASDVSGDRRIRWSLVSILMAEGKRAEAQSEIEKLRLHGNDVPDMPWNSELIELFMIRSFLENEEWRKAAESCQQWLRKRDDRPVIRLSYAEALRNLGNYKAAHNHLQLAIKQEPRELDFWYADILVCWEGKDYRQLQKALVAVETLGGDMNIVQRFSVLHKSCTGKDAKRTLTLLQDAVRRLGPEPELMHELAQTYLKVGLFKEARNWFKKTILLKSTSESAWRGQITALEAMLAEAFDEGERHTKGLLEQARQSTVKRMQTDLGALYKAYLKRWSDNVRIRRQRSLFLVKTFEYAEAARELEKLLSWDSSNASLRRVLAYTYRKTGRYREATVFLKPLLVEKPDDVTLLIEYTGCLERSGSASYALEVLEKASKLFTRSFDIFLALGVLNLRQNFVDRALTCLTKAAALKPNDPRPEEWLLEARRRGKFHTT